MEDIYQSFEELCSVESERDGWIFPWHRDKNNGTKNTVHSARQNKGKKRITQISNKLDQVIYNTMPF